MKNSSFKEKFNGLIYPIILWGCLWGITEATLGYILHLLPINIGWIFWYPIAFFYMNKVYTVTKKSSSIIYITLIAFLFKLINLFMSIRIDKVINPAFSILFEGAAVFYFYRYIKNQNIINIFIINISWRFLYMVYILECPQWIKDISALKNIESLMVFFIKESVITSIIIDIYLKLLEFYKVKLKDKITALINRNKDIEKQAFTIHNNIDSSVYKIHKHKDKRNYKATSFRIISLIIVLSLNILLKFI